MMSDDFLHIVGSAVGKENLKKLSIIDLDFDLFPNVRIVAGGGERFRDHSVALRDKLLSKHVDVVLDICESLWHCPSLGVCCVCDCVCCVRLCVLCVLFVCCKYCV